MTAIQFRDLDELNDVPVSENEPLPVIQADLPAVRPYQSTVIPSGVSSGNAANAIAKATIPAQGGMQFYVTALMVTASGATTGLPVVVTVTGLQGGTRSYVFVFPAGVLVSAYPLDLAFIPPLSGGLNTAVVATLPASGSGGTNAAINLEGFYQ